MSLRAELLWSEEVKSFVGTAKKDPVPRRSSKPEGAPTNCFRDDYILARHIELDDEKKVVATIIPHPEKGSLSSATRCKKMADRK